LIQAGVGESPSNRRPPLILITSPERSQLMIYREVMDDERYAFIIGWAETNNAQYDTRVKNGRVQVGLSAYHWRRAEYQGVAA
jgi:hypothetical protein